MPPTGLEANAWYVFSIFAGIVTALIMELFPLAATGLMGWMIVAVLAPWVLIGPKS